MKKALDKPNTQRVLISIKQEDQMLLEKKARALGTNKSKLITSMIRVINSAELDEVDSRIETEFKRIIGRSAFVSFLKSVQKVVGNKLTPIQSSNQESEYIPDEYKHQKSKTVLIARFSQDCEMYETISRATELIIQGLCEHAIVVVPEITYAHDELSRMWKMGIEIISIADLKDRLQELENIPQKKTKTK